MFSLIFRRLLQGVTEAPLPVFPVFYPAILPDTPAPLLPALPQKPAS